MKLDNAGNILLAVGLHERKLGLETPRTRYVNDLERAVDIDRDGLAALNRAGLKAEKQYVATQVKKQTVWAMAYANRTGRECSE